MNDRSDRDCKVVVYMCMLEVGWLHVLLSITVDASISATGVLPEGLGETVGLSERRSGIDVPRLRTSMPAGFVSARREARRWFARSVP